MCLMCEGWTSDEVNADLDERIKRHGWTLVGVTDRDGGPEWTYTVGLADHDHPELLVANVKVERAMKVVADLANRVVDGERFDTASAATFLDEAEATLRDVHPAHIGRGLVGSWESYYLWRDRPIPPLRVRQVVLPDSEFCRCHRGSQPRLDMPGVTFGTGAPNGAERRARRRRRSR